MIQETELRCYECSTASSRVQTKSQILKKKEHVCCTAKSSTATRKYTCAADESSHHFLIEQRDPIKILYSWCFQSVYNDPCHITFIFPFMCILCFQLTYLMSAGLPVYGVVWPKSTLIHFNVHGLTIGDSSGTCVCEMKTEALVNWTFYQADAATKFPISAW